MTFSGRSSASSTCVAPHAKSVPSRRNDELNCGVMRARLLRDLHGGLALALLAPGLSGCAHHGAPPPEGPSRAVVSEAGRIGRIAYEDDFTEARLVFQALPAERPGTRRPAREAAALPPRPGAGPESRRR